MGVRGRIIALQVGSVVALALAIGLAALGLSTADHSSRRIQAITERLDAASQLVGATGRYSSAVSQVLLLGAEKKRDLEDNRIVLERLLVRLSQATRSEIASLRGLDEMQSELPEIEASRRMIEVYHAIDAAVNRTLSMRRNGDTMAALEMLRVEVLFRLSNELEPLLDAAVADERGEIETEIKNLHADQSRLVSLATALAVLAIVVFGLLGWSLRRAVAASEAAQRSEFETAGVRLSSEVESRTAELRTANERLREVDRRRGQFLADVSHELRTPLTILRGEADVALRGRDDPTEQRQSLERIQGQAAELGQLLEDLIEYARSEAEDQPYEFEDVRLDEVIVTAAQEGEVLAAPREITLMVSLGDEGCHLNADFRRLKQALIIGVDNAIKHSPPGGTVEITTLRAAGYAVIAITDEGVGIAEADLPHVFERFFRGRNSGESLADGLGIGLAIAKEIVERHAGSIGLENRTGGGAILKIMLPVDSELHR